MRGRDLAALALVGQGIGVREWLATVALAPGVRTAAFDTRGSHPKAVVAFDHASSQIEKALAELGGSAVAPAEHFRVAGVTGPLEPANWTGPARGGAPWPHTWSADARPGPILRPFSHSSPSSSRGGGQP